MSDAGVIFRWKKKHIKGPAKTKVLRGKENKEAAMTINGHVVVGAEATALTDSVPF